MWRVYTPKTMKTKGKSNYLIEKRGIEQIDSIKFMTLRLMFKKQKRWIATTKQSNNV
ncbi:hypothetical protein HFA01_23130 [Halobacillus faecis]|uniref:Uncharacterized protein n=1 Tax=Halobacillus faecis TaxID=360184 RepID=A0A511WUL5_9BACI|nr:hypothetical protein HFA01_23130 [Halobacillus faecis]